MKIPVLVIVSGPPGAGKTTISRRLGAALGVPVIAKDDIKESLFGSLGWSDRVWSRKLGAATWNLLFLLLDRFLEAGTSFVMESNFDRRLHAEELSKRTCANDFRLIEVHCTAAAQTLARRYRERQLSGDRHPGHEGTDYVGDDDAFVAEIAKRQHIPLGTASLTLEVDTNDTEAVDLEGIIARIREEMYGPEDR